MYTETILHTGKNSVVQDYRIYSLSKKEALKYWITGYLAGAVLLYFFYHNLLVFIGGIPLGFIWCRYTKNNLALKRREELERGFKDWISAVASNLQAGYSVENAFLKGGKELELLYQKDSEILKEARYLEYHLHNNVTLESILKDLGKRSGCDDIDSFADVFIAGKRTGGDLRKMIENCCEIIIMRNDVEREIKTLIHGKVMEQKVMCVVPFAIIFYISLTSPGYFDPLYNNLPGFLIMSAVLGVYVFAVKLSLKISDIRV